MCAMKLWSLIFYFLWLHERNTYEEDMISYATISFDICKFEDGDRWCK